MKHAWIFRTFRGWSWIFGTLSLAPVIFGVYQNWQFSQWAAERDKNGEFVCGTGIVALTLLCAVLAFSLATCSVSCGFVDYIRTSKPRSIKRKIELGLVGNVFVFALVVYVIEMGAKMLQQINFVHLPRI
jgi:hypothetical protein